MRCVFVLDILNGAVVRGIKGERSRYEPVDGQSRVVTSSDPLEVLRQVDPEYVYVADLDRITGSGENLELIEKIASLTQAMADVGISELEELDLLGRAIPVLGTETGSMDLFERASTLRKVVVSVDMLTKKVMSRDGALRVSPKELISRLNRLELGGVILLELDRVGTSRGIDGRFLEEMAFLCDHPLILGGGVKCVDDLKVLAEIGFDGALIATAVHNGRISLDMLRR